MADSLLTFGTDAVVRTERVCNNVDCKRSDYVPEDASKCPDCAGPLKSIGHVLRAAQVSEKPASAPFVPPTHVVKPLPLLHGTQTLALHEDYLQKLFARVKLDDDEKEALVQWVALLGDGKTTELFSKLIESKDLQDRVMTVVGLMHEYMTAQKGAGNIAVALGGTEQLEAVGYKTPGAQQGVS